MEITKTCILLVAFISEVEGKPCSRTASGVCTINELEQWVELQLSTCKYFLFCVSTVFVISYHDVGYYIIFSKLFSRGVPHQYCEDQG